MKRESPGAALHELYGHSDDLPQITNLHDLNWKEIAQSSMQWFVLF